MSNVFIYFCGTDESTKTAVNHFAEKITAPYQIFVNGIGAKLSHNAKKIKLPGSNNSYYTICRREGKTVFTVEKQWEKTSSGKGASKTDLKKMVRYVAYVLAQHIKEIKPKNQLLLAGHSRGAAVCLPAFLELYILEKGDSWDGKKLENLLQPTKIDLLALDPVAGQTGNKYPKPMKKWNTGKLYNELYQRYHKKLYVTEVYAKAAQFTKLPGMKNFNPARKYLHHAPAEVEKQIQRYFLGYRHSSLINPSELYQCDYYESHIPHPSVSIIKYANKLLRENGNVSFSNVKDIPVQRMKRLADSKALNKAIQHRYYGSFKNNNGKLVKLNKFVKTLPDG